MTADISPYLQQKGRTEVQAIGDAKRHQQRDMLTHLPETFFILLDYGDEGFVFVPSTLGCRRDEAIARASEIDKHDSEKLAGVFRLEDGHMRNVTSGILADARKDAAS